MKCTDQLWVSDDYEETYGPSLRHTTEAQNVIYMYGVSKIITSYSFP